MKKTTAAIIGIALILFMAQFAAAVVSEEELQSISTPDRAALLVVVGVGVHK